MSLTMIVAATRDLAIGHGGDLLYHISEDLRHFKTLTMGHPVIMGRRTFESLPKGALPGRRNIVVTHNSALRYERADTVPSLQAALDLVHGQDAFIIGGAQIYKQASHLVDKIELTLIDASRPDADTRLEIPELASALHNLKPDFPLIDPRTGLRYAFLTLHTASIDTV